MLDKTTKVLPWQKALSAFEAKKYSFGDLIPHDWLWEQMGLTRPSKTTPHGIASKAETDFVDNFEKLRDALLRGRKMLLKNEWGEGYRIIEPGKQTDVAMDTAGERIRKEITRAQSALTNIRKDLLTDEERKANTDAVANMDKLSQMVRRKFKSPF